MALYANMCLLEHEDMSMTFFKGHRCFTNNLFMSIRHMDKEIPLLLFLCTEQFTYTNLFTFIAGQGSSLLNMQNVHSLLHLFASLCHILYFDAAKFSMKPFHLYI